MLVSESDQRILSFLAKFRFVPVEIIRAELFAHQRASSVKPYVSRRLKHLRDLGFVQSEYVLGKSQVHSLTPAGAEFMGVEGGPGAGVKLAEYAHDRACIDAYLALLHRGDRPHLITEREARALTTDPAENPYAIAITRASGKRGIAWPDIVSGERGSYIGYEVEGLSLIHICATPSPGGLDARCPLRACWSHPDCGRETSGGTRRRSHSP